MLQFLLLVGLIGQPPAGDTRITGAIDAVVVERGTARQSAEAGTTLAAGDRVIAPARGGAMWYHQDAAVVYLGPASTAEFESADDGLSLHLLQGEFRAVAGGRTPVHLSWATGRGETVRGIVVGGPQGDEVVFNRGIVWVQQRARDARIWCEQGSATVTVHRRSPQAGGPGPEIQFAVFQEGTQTITLAAGEELIVGADGSVQGPMPATGEGWLLDPSALRLAATVALGRTAREAQLREDEQIPPGGAEEGVEEFSGTNQIATTGGFALALGNVSGSSSFGASGAVFSDAQQDSVNLTFPGNIHLVTAQTSYVLSDVSLTAADNFTQTRQFWSIGTGAAPTGQVRTDLITGTNKTPTVLRIPGFDAYLVRLDQYGIVDPVSATTTTGQFGITGLVGSTPASPSIEGATPLTDERAQINRNATFALGEFAVDKSGDNPQFDMRRSDQDRRIVKDPGGNDDLDTITPNSDVTFADAQDFKFFPQAPAPGVKVPTSVGRQPGFGSLGNSQQDMIRKAAFTTLMADQLHDFSRRTGQTRFVVDGKIVDITGYRR